MSELQVLRTHGPSWRGAADVLGRLRQSQAWVLVALLVIVSLFVSPGMITGANGEDILRQCVILGLVTIGESVVLIGGGIDLSVAANVRIASIVGATYWGATNSSFLVGALLTIGVATAVGCVNGVLVGILRLPPFITTFAMLLILDGVTLTAAESAVGAAPDALINFYTEKLWFLPYPLLVLLLAAAVAAYCLRSTVWGKSVYAVGGNKVLAGHAGVRVTRTTFSVYAVSGFLAGVTALILLSRSGVGDPIALQGLELLAVTAAAIGGVSLAGGRGSLVGALGGVAFLTLVSVLLTQAGVPDRFLTLAQGLIILLALASYRQRSAKSA